MKKVLILFATLGASLTLSAQQPENPEAPKEARAFTGEYYATLQSTYTPSFKIDGSNAKVKNIILLIGDGMGQGAVNAGMFANGGMLTMTNLRTFGYVRTQSADNFTTDSAASGTAYATGQKTNNGYLGRDPQKQDLVNIPEKLAPLGFACGVLSTDDLNGATPAAFFAHQDARNAKEGIWADLATSCLTYASAGSQSVYESMPLGTQEAIRKEFTVVYDPADPAVAGSKRLLYLPKTTGDDRGDYLPANTTNAIEYLAARSKKGFFLMVEGSSIDDWCHRKKVGYMAEELFDFDRTIGKVLKWAEQDGQTLVIVTADHATGGLTLIDGSLEDRTVKVHFSTKGHNGILVPVFAYGPHAEAFTGVHENGEVGQIVRSLMK